MRIQAIRQERERLFIEWENGDQADFSFFWLRDHCQHPESLNPETLQRTVETFSLPTIPPVSDVQLIHDNRSLQIDWKNENFLSEYTSEFLHQFGVPVELKPVYSLWNNGLQHNIPDFHFPDVIKDDDALLAMLEAFLTYGLVTFSGMVSNLQATRTLLERVGYIRNSIFGELWDFSNNQKHSDSAYTSVGIGLHTDSTYCIDPPGMQLLHCLAFDGEGAYNQFADGFFAANAVRQEDPEAYECLKEIAVPAHYFEPGIHLRAAHPVVTEDEDGNLEQICFNNFDRSPFKLSADKQALFYRAYGRFHELVNDPENQVRFQLRPGRAVWFDNWRTLHARTSFSGFRHLAGGYTNREDYISKLITLRGQRLWRQN